MAKEIKQKTLLEEAIADARQIKQAALTNAKAQLEEAFTPQLQSLFKKNLKQEMEDDFEDEITDDEEITEEDEIEDDEYMDDEEVTEEDENMEDEDDFDISDDVLEEMLELENVKDLGLEDYHIEAIKADIAFAKKYKDDYVLYECY